MTIYNKKTLDTTVFSDYTIKQQRTAKSGRKDRIMDNNFKPITPESESAAIAASEEAAIYTPPVIVRKEPKMPTETETPVAFNAPAEPAIASEKKPLDYAKIFASPLYCAICVLTTIIFAFDLLGGGGWLFPLLFMIAGWVTYGNAKKKESPISGLAFTKGLITAEYVIGYVCGGLMILAGAGLISLHFTTSFTFKEIIDETINSFNQYSIKDIPFIGNSMNNIIEFINNAYQTLVNYFASAGISESALHSIIFISISMCLALGGAFVLLFNVLCTRKINIFAGSVCENAKNPDAEILKAKAVKNWLMVIGVFMAIFVFWSFWSLLTSAITAALIICASVFVKKNFVEEK